MRLHTCKLSNLGASSVLFWDDLQHLVHLYLHHHCCHQFVIVWQVRPATVASKALRETGKRATGEHGRCVGPSQ